MYTIDRFFLNIVEAYKLLREDFTGIAFNMLGISGVLINIAFSLLFIPVFYLIGNKIKKIFKNTDYNDLNFFINIALGYIFFGTFIAFLGLFSFLYPFVLAISLSSFVFFALYPLTGLIELKKDLLILFKQSVFLLRSHKWILIGVVLFVLISFLRLIPPEIGEDAIGYHTDLPQTYLASKTMIIDSRDLQRVIPIPQLGEMPYLINQSIGIKDASRYMHFLFYLLIIAVLLSTAINSKTKRLNLYYAPILFVTSSVIIRHASKANVDFQALFCFLVSVLIITRHKSTMTSSIAIPAIIFGGVLSTKLWSIVYLPVFILFFFLWGKVKANSIKLGLIFFFFSILVASIWYIRSFIITGNPFFPAFSYNEKLNDSYLGFNLSIFSRDNLFAFGPLFFLGILFLFYNPFKSLNKLKNLGIFLFIVLLAIEHLFVKYYLARYLLAIFALGTMIASSGVNELIKIKFGKYFFATIYCAIFFYYFANTIAILPYGFGWADKNKYLTRILSRDSSSYYDFAHLFDKHISENDLVATYRLAGFYYANFRHVDIGYIFDEKNKSFDLLRRKGATKLLIFGGDVPWFCKQLKLTGCSSNKYKLLASYDKGNRYLYSLLIMFPK